MRRRSASARSITVQTGKGGPRRTIRIGAHNLTLDVRLPDPFTPRSAAPTLSRSRPASRAPWLGPRSLLYHGTQRIGGSALRVRCESTPGALRLQMLPLGQFTITSDGSEIHADLHRHPLNPVMLLGPPLLLAMARQRVFALHASAVTIGGKTVAFCGISGAGKSTLAAFFARRGRGSMRIADDVLLSAFDATGVTAFPHYPQLKLGRQSQPARECPEQLPLAAVCILGSASRRFRLQAFPPLEAALALAKHTACAHLYDLTTLFEHLAFCADVAEWIPVYELSYLRTQKQLERVAGAIETELAD